MYRVLVPGGYAQLVEIDPEWVSGPRTAMHMLFLNEILGERGMLLHCGVKWAGEDGVQGRDRTIGALKGMRGSVMRAGGLGRFASGEEFNKEVEEIAEEWDNTKGSYTIVQAFYSRKPF